MRVIESCAECLYGKQRNISDDPDFLSEIKEIIDSRKEGDTAPYLIWKFSAVQEKYLGKRQPFREIKKRYNDLVLSMEEGIRQKIESSPDPLHTALLYARAGNYIDFGAMDTVDEEEFFSLLDEASSADRDQETYGSFLKQCETADRFLLITDNCGEIVLDRLFLEQLKKRFPGMELTVLVRGKEVLNDATREDAVYTGLEQIAEIIDNGEAIAGTIFEYLPDHAKKAIGEADVILSKGQANYESLCRQGWHIFYSFLCKCELFTDRFNVPRLTGIFIEERE
ncbi:MAG: ARMT1-like domain-containing protein [Solobacterium sp.]|nr:ARMT1-like domain-containing protein [Solobacterium sp.]